MGFYQQGFIFMAIFAAGFAYGLYAQDAFIVGLCLSPILMILSAMIHAAARD